MLAEILSTGEELRSGSLVDSNSAYIAEKLYTSGIELTRINCVGDNLEALVSILKEIARRSDIAIVTGGLGPTPDDLTAEAAAKAAGQKLIFNEEAFESIKAFFKKIGRHMEANNKKQAFLPENSEKIDNNIGTAPGFTLKIQKCCFFFLPGVPVEMKYMLNNYVLSIIYNQASNKFHIPISNTLIIFGTPESKVGSLIEDIPDRYPGIKIGTRARLPEIQVKIYTNNYNDKILLEKATELVAKRLEKWLISKNGESIELVLGDLLKQRNANLAIAESCTGGFISNLITSVPGSSEYFLFSAVTYSNKAKEEILKVSKKTLLKYGAVSIETVKEMASGVKNITNSSYAVSTSGIAGPGGGTNEKPVGTLCVGIATPETVDGYKYFLPFGNREQKKKIFAMASLDVLRREILGIPKLIIDKK